MVVVGVGGGEGGAVGGSEVKEGYISRPGFE